MATESKKEHSNGRDFTVTACSNRTHLLCLVAALKTRDQKALFNVKKILP
jgi:hypothetical protein